MTRSLQSILLLTIAFLLCCQHHGKPDNHDAAILSPQRDSITPKTYEQIVLDIARKRQDWAARTLTVTDSMRKVMNDFWVNAISVDLYTKWKGTPWDFNGHTMHPQQGTIACGYFVSTLLKDMGLPINRSKLAICPSSVMMRSLVPGKPLKNYSGLDEQSFNDKLKYLGKGVYVVGLDFHTGFIVNDGNENWFIHSNYIGRKGVTREPVLGSAALNVSKTKWLVSLTQDKDFLQKWLRG